MSSKIIVYHLPTIRFIKYLKWEQCTGAECAVGNLLPLCSRDYLLRHNHVWALVSRVIKTVFLNIQF